jgi:hypothetical protein
MENGPVVASAKGFANGSQGGIGHLPGKEHRDLSWEGDALGATFAGHIRESNVEMFGNSLLDQFDANRVAAFFMKDFAEQAFDNFDAELFACERGEGSDADESAFKAANIGSDTIGQEIDDVVRQLDAHELRLFVENGEAHFDIRRLQIGDQTPFEAGNEAMFEILDLAGRTVAGQDDLLMALVQGVEGVKEFFLDTLFAREKLDIIDQKHISLTILFAELNELIVLDAINVFVRKLFRRKISDPGTFLVCRDMMANGVEQMRFAKTDTAVKEKRIVGFAGRLSNR